MMSPGNIFVISLELNYHLIGSENTRGSNFKLDKICIKSFTFLWIVITSLHSIRHSFMLSTKHFGGVRFGL